MCSIGIAFQWIGVISWSSMFKVMALWLICLPEDTKSNMIYPFLICTSFRHVLTMNISSGRCLQDVKWTHRLLFGWCCIQSSVHGLPCCSCSIRFLSIFTCCLHKYVPGDQSLCSWSRSNNNLYLFQCCAYHSTGRIHNWLAALFVSCGISFL